MLISSSDKPDTFSPEPLQNVNYYRLCQTETAAPVRSALPETWQLHLQLLWDMHCPYEDLL